jgi:hypothetical protein
MAGLSHFECVGEFHDMCLVPQKSEPYVDVFHTNTKLIPFRISLIDEELNELKKAFYDKNLEEIADALCDIAYVVHGAGQCLGVNLDKLMREMRIDIRSNFNLIDKLSDADIIKKHYGFIQDGIRQLDNALLIFSAAAGYHKFDIMCIWLPRMLQITYSIGHGLGFNMNLMFREVHRSNMAKSCSSIEDAQKSVDYYKEQYNHNSSPYKDPSYRVVAGKDNKMYYVIYDASTSKILKKKDWEKLEKPNLKQFF